MEKRKEKLGFVMMFVFIVMNFVHVHVRDTL